MGAPAGHPFFGNQYTDGGYVQGSYTYGVEAAKKVAESVSQAAASVAKPIANTRASVPAPSVKDLRMPPLSIRSLVAAGVVVLIGGVATYAYLKFKSAGASEPAVEAENIASFGVCESCGEPLASSGPVELQQDDGGDFLICQSCSHKNRTRYGEEDEQDQPEQGSD